MFNNEFQIKQIADKKTLDIYLYGEIEKDYLDWWTGKIVESKTSANYIRRIIDEAGNVDFINVYINSIGGDVDEGVAIHNILKRSNAYVTVYVDAYAYSIASVIAMAGDKVIMPVNATMMIHNPSGSKWGNAQQHRDYADALDVIGEAAANSYLAKSKKITKEELKTMLDKDTFLTADSCLKYGFCDEVDGEINIENSKEVVEQARSKKNPMAKQAAEYLQKQMTPNPQANPSPQNNGEPKPKKEPQAQEKLNLFEKLKNNKKE